MDPSRHGMEAGDLIVGENYQCPDLSEFEQSLSCIHFFIREELINFLFHLGDYGS